MFEKWTPLQRKPRALKSLPKEVLVCLITTNYFVLMNGGKKTDKRHWIFKNQLGSLYKEIEEPAKDKYKKESARLMREQAALPLNLRKMSV